MVVGRVPVPPGAFWVQVPTFPQFYDEPKGNRTANHRLPFDNVRIRIRSRIVLLYKTISTKARLAGGSTSHLFLLCSFALIRLYIQLEIERLSFSASASITFLSAFETTTCSFTESRPSTIVTSPCIKGTHYYIKFSRNIYIVVKVTSLLLTYWVIY